MSRDGESDGRAAYIAAAIREGAQIIADAIRDTAPAKGEQAVAEYDRAMGRGGDLISQPETWDREPCSCASTDHAPGCPNRKGGDDAGS